MRYSSTTFLPSSVSVYDLLNRAGVTRASRCWISASVRKPSIRKMFGSLCTRRSVRPPILQAGNGHVSGRNANSRAAAQGTLVRTAATWWRRCAGKRPSKTALVVAPRVASPDSARSIAAHPLPPLRRRLRLPPSPPCPFSKSSSVFRSSSSSRWARGKGVDIVFCLCGKSEAKIEHGGRRACRRYQAPAPCRREEELLRKTGSRRPARSTGVASVWRQRRGGCDSDARESKGAEGRGAPKG